MKRSSLIAIIGIAVFGITVLALKCGNDPPETPGAPVPVNTEIYQRATVGFNVSAVQPQGKDVRFVMDWGDGTIDTSDVAVGSEETGTVYHKWTDVASYQVKALAVLDEDPNLASDWSEATTVSVLPNDPPVRPDIAGPNTVPKGRYVFFSGRATDPDGDSIALRFNFGGSWGGWTEFVPSGGIARDSHKFSGLETTYVFAIAKDIKGSESDNSETLQVIVDTVAVVEWWWITPDEDEGPPITSPVLRVWGEDTLVYFGAEDENGTFYSVNTNTGRKEGSERSVVAEEGWFTGHPAFCSQTGHIIVGADDGELYAFDLDLRRAWHYPGYNNEDSLTYLEWGPPAIIQNKIYVPCDNDSLYYFLDNGSIGTLQAAYYVVGILDGPVIDNSGNVIFVTDSGYVYKMNPTLTAPTWRTPLGTGMTEVYGPVIDAGGTIYVGTDDGKVVALNPTDGSVKWEKTFDGTVVRMALGATNIYFGTGLGSVYAIRQADGGQVWKKSVSPSDFLTTPIVAANGLIYIQDADDVLYCMKESDGTVVWSCNCLDYGPIYSKGKAGRKVDFFEGNPTLCPNGDIIVVGVEALYCVSGYTAGTLGATPWPKWQHDLSNTGRVGGSW